MSDLVENTTTPNIVKLTVNKGNAWCTADDVLDMMCDQIKENFPIKDIDIYTYFGAILIRWGPNKNKDYRYDMFVTYLWTTYEIFYMVNLLIAFLRLICSFLGLICAYFSPSLRTESWGSIMSILWIFANILFDCTVRTFFINKLSA